MTVKLERIHVPKTCDVVADHLRKQILQGAFVDGSPLPAERDLVHQTGVSRGSVREALRILQAEGLVHTRPGKLGGSIVRRPGAESLAKYIGLFVHGRRIALESLLQARVAVEPPLAALAALNRSDDDIRLLTEVTARMEEALPDAPRFLVENVEWHCALALASHNEILQAFIVAISNLIHQASAIEDFASEEIRAAVIKAHRRILDAIVAKDGEAASRRMTRHLLALTHQMKAFAPANAALG
jgi:GntR family transcriptional regulator, transcriptional repressor for pyruvate dehydrogenase complex